MTINRRTFVRAGLALGALPITALPLTALASALTTDSTDSYFHQFHQALAQKPWLSAYKSVGQHAYSSQAKVLGKWPQGLQGVIYRNGAAQHEIGTFRYHHWFDGDGMLQAFRFSAKGVTHQAKMIATHKYVKEAAAGKALYTSFGTVPPNAMPVSSPDDVNPGNISVLPHHGKLLALWEAGSAWEVDPDTLDTKGIYSFSENMQGVPFSAHPRVEPDGTLWNFGYYSVTNLLILWHIDASGKLIKAGKIKVDPITMPHDFIVTTKHIVFLLPPLNYEHGGEGSFIEQHHWQPQKPTRVLVVSKNDFKVQKQLELPSQWLFHFGNGWEDSAGVIRFDGVRYPSPSIMTKHFNTIMRGKSQAYKDDPLNVGNPYLYAIDTKKWTIKEQPLYAKHMAMEFPVIDPRVSCQQYRRIITLSCDKRDEPAHGHLNEVSVIDINTGQRAFYRYSDNQIPEEHLFVPKPGSAPETDGWLLGTVHDWAKQVTLLNVFDINAVDAGPIAQAVLPYALPLGLHGKFVAG